MQWPGAEITRNQPQAKAANPRVNPTDGAALSPRIRALIERRQQQAAKEGLKRRVAQLQEVVPVGKPVSDPLAMTTNEAALARAEMIVKVRAGLMTATAEALEVSRKTYDKWEEKGLHAMLEAEQDETGGSRQTGPTRRSWS